MFFLSVIILSSMLTGCATVHQVSPAIYTVPSGGIHHTVKSGETLWSISKLYDVDLNVLVKRNSLEDSRVISKGQALFIPGASQIKDEAKLLVAKDVFLWPVKGSLVAAFYSKINKIRNKGIDIKSEEGSSVRASRGGRVVYCDSNFRGFGKTIILDHGDGYETVYSYNSDIIANVGDIVQQNDVIAKAGSTGRAKGPSLHFEIRRNGEPQNPAYYLPING